MFRGAIILGIGFSLGYAKALQDSQEIKDLLLQVLKELEKDYKERTAAADDAASSDTVEGDAVDVTPDTSDTTSKGE